MITPVAEAFDHCLGMSMSGNLSENQDLVIAMVDDEAGPMHNKSLVKGLQHKQIERECDSKTMCSFHASAVYNMSSLELTDNSVSSSLYSNDEYVLRHSTTLSPALRPPIVRL